MKIPEDIVVIDEVIGRMSVIHVAFTTNKRDKRAMDITIRTTITITNMITKILSSLAICLKMLDPPYHAASSTITWTMKAQKKGRFPTRHLK